MIRKLQSDAPTRAVKNPARETEHTTQGTTSRQKEKVHEPRQKDAKHTRVQQKAHRDHAAVVEQDLP